VGDRLTILTKGRYSYFQRESNSQSAYELPQNLLLDCNAKGIDRVQIKENNIKMNLKNPAVNTWLKTKSSEWLL
jgi:hypothetical protein